MAHFDIAVGTVLGASEYVADALLETLEKQGHSGTIHLEPELSALSADNIWIVCTSTHGAGDLPDNIQPLHDELAQSSLSDTRYLVVGLGDSSYDTFCYGAQKMEQILTQQGATLLAPAIHIDVLNHPIPEDHAAAWLSDWLLSFDEAQA